MVRRPGRLVAGGRFGSVGRGGSTSIRPMVTVTSGARSWSFWSGDCSRGSGTGGDGTGGDGRGGPPPCSATRGVDGCGSPRRLDARALPAPVGVAAGVPVGGQSGGGRVASGCRGSAGGGGSCGPGWAVAGTGRVGLRPVRLLRPAADPRWPSGRPACRSATRISARYACAVGPGPAGAPSSPEGRGDRGSGWSAREGGSRGGAGLTSVRGATASGADDAGTAGATYSSSGAGSVVRSNRESARGRRPLTRPAERAATRARWLVTARPRSGRGAAGTD